jgi:hypothetical protein
MEAEQVRNELIDAVQEVVMQDRYPLENNWGDRAARRRVCRPRYGRCAR